MPKLGSIVEAPIHIESLAVDYTMAADLVNGIPIWTPKVGDWLLDVWFENPDPGWTADGDFLPKVDVGVLSAGSFADTGGFFNRFIGAPDLSSSVSTVGTKFNYTPGTPVPLRLSLQMIFAMWPGGSPPVDPAVRFNTTDPISVVLSSDGTPSGDTFDGSAGSSIVYLSILTPSS